MLASLSQICQLLELNPMSKCFCFLVISHTLEHLLYAIYSYSYMTVPPKKSLRKFSLPLICHSQEDISLLLTMHGLQHCRGKERACALEFPCLIIANLKLGERVLGNYLSNTQLLSSSSSWSSWMLQAWILSEEPNLLVIGRACLSYSLHNFMWTREKRQNKKWDFHVCSISLTFCHVAFSNKEWNIIHQTYMRGPDRLWSH